MLVNAAVLLFVKGVKYTFSCSKYILLKKIIMTFQRHKMTYPFLAYLGLESGVQ